MWMSCSGLLAQSGRGHERCTFWTLVFLFATTITWLGVWLGQLLDTRREGCLPYSVLRFMLWVVGRCLYVAQISGPFNNKSFNRDQMLFSWKMSVLETNEKESLKKGG